MTQAALAKWEGVGGDHSAEWETPPLLFDALNHEFGFTVDVCATGANAKVLRFYDRSEDGLAQSWQGEVCWMNPPYRRREIDRWMRKAYQESRAASTIVVALVHARTDAAWWHNWAMKARELRFIRGRLRFGHPDRDTLDASPSPSAIVVFDQHSNGPPQIRSTFGIGGSWKTA